MKEMQADTQPTSTSYNLPEDVFRRNARQWARPCVARPTSGRGSSVPLRLSRVFSIEMPVILRGLQEKESFSGSVTAAVLRRNARSLRDLRRASARALANSQFENFLRAADKSAEKVGL